MILYALSNNDRKKNLKVLDYGGGGGQFSLVAKSLFPKLDTYIVDLNDLRLLEAFKPLNKQIKFKDFPLNKTKFDIIFMNDVFEHLTDPISVLKKLKNRIFLFICAFWG